MFRQALLELGLGKESPSLYTLRHGGASHDLLAGLRPVAEVKERGRWVSDKSLRRYGKRTRMQQRVLDLPKDVAVFGELVGAQLGKLMITTFATGNFPLVVPLQPLSSDAIVAKVAPVMTRR